MRIFYAFIIIFVSAILFMLPFTQMAYDFRTDPRTDVYTVDTAVGITTGNESLYDDLYDDDMGSIDIDSTLATDIPMPSSYNTTTRLLDITGLTANTTRTLSITYDYDALDASEAIATLIDRLPWVWLLVCVAFSPAALFAIFTGRA